MNYFTALLFYFPILFVLQIILFFVGGSIRNIFIHSEILKKENVFEQYIKNVLFVFLLISSITAIVYTRLVTTHILLLILLILWIYLNKKNHKILFTRQSLLNALHFKFFITLFTNSIIAFTILYFFNTTSDHNNYFHPDPDLLFYAKLSSSMIHHGIENVNTLGMHFYDVNGIELYHYTDLWFNGFLFKLTGMSEVKLLILVVYPLLLILALYSIASLFKDVSDFKSIVFAYLILFGSNVFLRFLVVNYKGIDFLYFFARSFRGLHGFIYFSTKVLIIVPLIIYGINYFKNNKPLQSFIFFSIAGIAYNTIIPGIAGGVFCLTLISVLQNIYLKDYMKAKNVFFAAIIPFLVFLMLIFINSISPTIESEFIPNTNPLKTNLVFVFETLFKSFSVFIVLCLLIIISIKYSKIILDNNITIIFTIGVVIFSIATQWVTINMQNSYQITRNIIPTVFTILSAVFFATFVNEYKNKILVSIFVVIMLFSIGFNIQDTITFKRGTFSEYDDKTTTTIFYAHIINEMKQTNSNTNYAILSDTKYTVKGLNYTVANAILQIPHLKMPIELSYVSNGCDSCIEQTSNIALCNEIYGRNIDLNDTDKLLLFLQNKDVNYLFKVGSVKIPNYLENIIDTLYAEPNSKDVFYKINYNMNK
jgi:hypothetical protein